ncbi:MAG: DUF3098 domain-containing protein [Bacteroidota bacterium]
MSKKSPKKKVVVSTRSKTAKKVTPTSSRVRQGATTNVTKEPLLFDKQNYLWMGVGILLIALGMILMMGGNMPDPDTWDPKIIYGFRRTVLAPFLILAGLVIEIFAIFKGSKA